MKRRQATVQLDDALCEEMFAVAEAGLPNETGGILVGWYDDATIVVERFLEVPSADATGTSYVREHSAAEAALADVLADEPEGSPIGYVGEWHSHPAPLGPSPTDFGALRRIASRAEGPVALVVVMRSRDGSWTATSRARTSERRRLRRKR